MGHQHEPLFVYELPGNGTDAVGFVFDAQESSIQIPDKLLLPQDHAAEHFDFRMQAAVIKQISTVLVVGRFAEFGQLLFHEGEFFLGLVQFANDERAELFQFFIGITHGRGVVVHCIGLFRVRSDRLPKVVGWTHNGFLSEKVSRHQVSSTTFGTQSEQIGAAKLQGLAIWTPQMQIPIQITCRIVIDTECHPVLRPLSGIMHISIITVIPDLLQGPLQHSIIGRAGKRGLLEIDVVDLREYGIGKHRQVDDYAYGGGAGMVMMPGPLMACIESLQAIRSYDEIIYMAPDGRLLDQPMANRLSLKGNLMILCGHYKGIDERIRQHVVTMEVSIGNYVLSGGELAAAVLVDAVGRLLPGVMNDETSALFDSFQDGLVAPPVYTRPARFRDWEVPSVLLSGNESAIEAWRYEQALARTRQRRPTMLQDE